MILAKIIIEWTSCCGYILLNIHQVGVYLSIHLILTWFVELNTKVFYEFDPCRLYFHAGECASYNNNNNNMQSDLGEYFGCVNFLDKQRGKRQTGLPFAPPRLFLHLLLNKAACCQDI